LEKFVDVRKLIADKNPALLKWLPGFFIRWIERIIHQEEVNEFMSRHHADNVFEFCKGIVEEFKLHLHVKGMENIPKDAPVIFAANHPLGGLDAITIIHLFKDVRPDLKFIVNDILMVVKNLNERFIGVNKVGKNAAESLQRVEEQFATGSATFIFPAGLVSRKIMGKIRDLDWKKTFITKAKKYKRPIIPVYINGRLTNRFYRLANIRKRLGVKVNIEMFYLVDEFFKQKNMHIDITIGAPIQPEVLTKDRSDKEWAEWVKQQVYELN